jgi:outer membrane protein insertion porin family
MHTLRGFGLIVILLSILSQFTSAAETNDRKRAAASIPNETQQQQLVESVDIQGNRRLRDEDLLYYIKTRPGDVYDPRQLERDLKELLSLSFFDKTATRVLTEEGVRGGLNVIFEVKELPIIRDLQFVGMKAVPESDILKQFRENRIGISKEAVFDPVKVNAAKRLIRELLASKGFPNATVKEEIEEVSATSVAVTFNVDQGRRSRIIKIEFEGNERFKNSELRNAMELVKSGGLVSRFKGMDILDLRKLEYDLQKNVREYMFSKGYFQARIGDPQVVGLGYKRTSILPLIVLPVPLISTKDDTLKIIVPVNEGKIFRVGEVKIEGNSIISEEQVRNALGLKKGEIADGKHLRKVLYEDLKKFYGSQGFVLYEPNFDVDYRENPANAKEGIIDINIEIDEGKQYRLRRLEFTGNTFTRDRVLRREVLINEGDIYNQAALENSVIRLNQTGYFDPIDKDKDVTIRTANETGDVDLIVGVKEKGRQQIQFNGGVSGLGGTFFGLEYSTNNLLGRGETLAIQAGVGNRQTNIQISFTEPYFRNRPITIGGSVFSSKYKFFGEGTFLSENQNLFYDAANPYGRILTDQSNLFTQSTYGASLFATAPLSEFFFKKRRFTQFSRLGLTYQFAATSIKDPAVNQAGDASKTIPVIFAQPNIITSRITPTFVYDTREPAANGIDTLRGKQIAVSLGFAGLGGSVRTYSPSVSYTHFIPIRRKRSNNAEVFGFRILVGTVGSWSTTDKVRNANSLAFVGNVPFAERFFLGSENDIRGYEVRTIGPVAPVDTYVTSRNVIVANNSTGTPDTATGLSERDRNELIAIGTFTGAGGANPGLISKSFQIIGGDTEFLGNFEYRIPIIGPVSLAGFADIGSAFNLRKGADQLINSNFLPDQPFLGFNSLSTIFFRNNTELQPSFLGGFLLRNGRPITRSQFVNDFCNNDVSQCPVIPPTGLQQVFLRGEAQTNQVIRIRDSLFGKLGDFKSSVGMELRVQVPVVNVPFRLIYYYNPNAKLGFTQELPNLFLPGKRNGFRFTVGRTF